MRAHARGPGSLLFDGCNHLFMAALMLVMLYPMWNTLVVSFSAADPVGRGLVSFLPVGPLSLNGYELVLRTGMVARAYMNTVLYAGAGTVLSLLCTLLLAYPLSRKDLPGRRIISFAMTVLMVFPGGMIASFLLIKELGLLDSRWAVILPTVASFWNVIMMRTFIQQTIPESLFESAHMDGAGQWRVLFQIVVPLSGAVMATLAMYSVVGHWNSFLSALLYLNDSRKYPLQIVLRRVLSAQDDAMAMLGGLGKAAEGSGMIERIRAAAVMVTVGPIIAAYPFVQRYFIKGAMVGSVKG